MKNEKKRIICNNCDRELVVQEKINETCEINVCPYCADEDVSVIEELEDVCVSFE